MDKLSSKNRWRVIDLLKERLVFERSGVRLYDTLLSRLRHAGDPALEALVAVVQSQRDEEQEHAQWLEQQIRGLGGDGHALSDLSILVQVESEGVERVIRRDASIPHDFHALLTAELADNAGWDLLAQIADELGDAGAKQQFEKRLREEEKHLAFVRQTLLELTKKEVSVAPEPPPPE